MRRLIPLVALLLVGCPRDERFIDRDDDGATADVDCDDDNPDVFPLRAEVPYDGVDNDCDPTTPDDDLDGDGLGPPADCDDRDPLVRPGILERPYDGVDQDCDPSTRDDDLDEDGVNGNDDCNDNAPGIFPGNVETYYDNVDNDCNPLTADDDQDNDGVPVDLDCDDLDGLVRDGLLYHLDCDADGFAASVDGAVQACSLPPSPPAACTEPHGTWTIVEPVGPAFDPLNTTVDCSDQDSLVFPGQTEWFTSRTLALPAGSTFDYDCDGENIAEHDTYSCSVGPGSLPGTTACTYMNGFATDASCGVVELFQEGCVELSATTCEPMMETPLVRACH